MWNMMSTRHCLRTWESARLRRGRSRPRGLSMQCEHCSGETKEYQRPPRSWPIDCRLQAGHAVQDSITGEMELVVSEDSLESCTALNFI